MERHEPEGVLVKPGVVTVGDGTDNDGSKSPEHLQHLRSRGSQPHGHDLTAVRRRVGDEDAPRQALEKLGHQVDGERVAKVEDEDECVQEHETGDGGPAVSDIAGERTSKADADQGTEWPGDLERRLPVAFNDILLICLMPDAVPVRERR